MIESKIYRSSYPAPKIPTDISVSQFLSQINPDAVAEDKVILQDDWTELKLTYSSIRRNAARHASTMRRNFGLRPGDVVAISAPNSVAQVQLIHTVLWAGGTVSLINYLGTEDDFTHCFKISTPRLVVVDSTLCATANQALLKSSQSSNVKMITLGDPREGLVHYPTDFEAGHEIPPFDLTNMDNRNHTAAICFSSGTSGNPKGVELSHHNLIASLAGVRATDPSFHHSESRTVFFAPLCHIYGLFTVALMGAWVGSYNMLMKRFVLDDFLRLCSMNKANNLRIVPSIALAMIKSAYLDDIDLTSVSTIMCTGAALQPEIVKMLQKKFNRAPIFQGYGMTETNIATLRSHESHKSNSVGRLYANIEARIVDDNFKDVPEGVDGELLVRGPSVFRRYVNNPDATAEAFHDGWMKTGDVLHIDSAGFLYLTDRKKELIKYKGFQVAPSELEGILTSHPYVDEGVVCAKWDVTNGTEVPMAYITLAVAAIDPPKTRTEIIKDVQAYFNGKVSPYKKLRGGIEVLQEIPKTASGKILRRVLREQGKDKQLSKL